MCWAGLLAGSPFLSVLGRPYSSLCRLPSGSMRGSRVRNILILGARGQDGCRLGGPAGVKDNQNHESFLCTVGCRHCRGNARPKTVFLKNSSEDCEGVISFMVETLGKPLGKIMDIVSWEFFFFLVYVNRGWSHRSSVLSVSPLKVVFPCYLVKICFGVIY